MKAKIITVSALSLLSLLFTGCASIVDCGKKPIHINSNPPGAQVTIYNKTGQPIATNTTPATVVLRRGGFYSTQNYRLHFELAGYYPYDTHVRSQLDGWYFGNFGFGGLVGFLIVDPSTGCMWTLSPRNLNCNLVSSAVALTPEELKAAQLKANPSPKHAAPPPDTKDEK